MKEVVEVGPLTLVTEVVASSFQGVVVIPYFD